jgi:hypothetical protein
VSAWVGLIWFGGCVCWVVSEGYGQAGLFAGWEGRAALRAMRELCLVLFEWMRGGSGVLRWCQVCACHRWVLVLGSHVTRY